MIESELGKGNYCKVFSGSWKGQEVAIKSINLGGEDPDKARGMLKNEIALLQELDHPNVLHCIKAGLGFFMSEKMPHGDLYHFLHPPDATAEKTEQHLSFIQKLDIALQISEGMQYVHAKDIIHADLHTANILVSLFPHLLFLEMNSSFPFIIAGFARGNTTYQNRRLWVCCEGKES